jgi:hypothetical protein
VFRTRQEDVHFDGDSEWRDLFGIDIDPAAAKVSAIAIAPLESAIFILPGENHWEPQWIT